MTSAIRFTAGTLLVIAAAGTAFADGRVRITDAAPTTSPYNGSDGSGGAFIVTRAAPLANGDYNGVYGGNLYGGDGRGTGATSFLSFCLERQDNLAFNTTYYTQIATSAYDTSGTINNPNPDTLDGVTASIYREFRRIASTAGTTVTTTGFFGGALGTTLANTETSAIQNAIWYSEQELGSISGLALTIYNWGVANNTGVGNVRVLRLWDNYNANTGAYSGSHQDLLTMVPLPPSAYAGMGTLAGILGLAVARRRQLAAQ